MSIMKRAAYVVGAVAACLIAVPVLAANTGVTIQIPAATVVTSLDAASVTLLDAAGLYLATDVEAALAEVRTRPVFAAAQADVPTYAACTPATDLQWYYVTDASPDATLAGAIVACAVGVDQWRPLFAPWAHASRHLVGESDAVIADQLETDCADGELLISETDVNADTGKSVGCLAPSYAAASHAHAAGDITSGQLGVANGGTGVASLTAYAPVCGGTTTTGAVQSCGTGQSNAGYVYTSNGASAPPSWQAASGGGGLGGSVGSTDNAIPRADGIDGDTVQGGSLVTISDAGHMVFSGTWGFSGSDSNGMRLTTTSPDTPGRFLIQDRLGTTPFVYNDGYVYSPGGSALFLGSDIFGTGLTVTGFAVTAPSAGVPASASAMAFSVFADRVQIRSGSCFAWSTSATDSDASAAATGAQICLTPTDAPSSCGDASRGAIYFDDSLGEHCGCRGATGAASWQQLDGGGAC